MSANVESRLRPSHPLHLVVGLILWSLWFVVLYGGLSVACAVSPPSAEQGALTAINIGLGLFTLAVTALLAWLGWLCLRAARVGQGRPRFFAGMSAGMYAVSVVATLFTGVPLIAMPPCV